MLCAGEMDKTKIRIYASVHKGIRNLIARFSFHAGKTDWTDFAAFSVLHNEWEVVLKLLNSHQEHEDKFIHPVLDKVSLGSHRGYQADHHVQWKVLNNLDSQFNRLLNGDGSEDGQETGLEFYRQLNLFYSEFLKHLNREETEAERILNALCLPEDLMRMLDRIISCIPQDEMLLYIDCMFPAMNFPECVQLMKIIRKSAPKELLNSLEERVLGIRGEEDWRIIKKSMENRSGNSSNQP